MLAYKRKMVKKTQSRG